MRTKLLTVSALLVGCTAASRPMFAHHGAVAYERKSVTLKGTVTKFEWNNPHTVLTLAVKDSKGNVEEWYAEILPPSRMLQAGWTRESIRPGDQVTVTGRPGKHRERIMWLEYLVTPDGRKLGRDNDAP